MLPPAVSSGGGTGQESWQDLVNWLATRSHAMKNVRKPTLEQLLAATPAAVMRSSEALEWERMPAVGREWPNEGWDTPPAESEPKVGALDDRASKVAIDGLNARHT